MYSHPSTEEKSEAPVAREKNVAAGGFLTSTVNAASVMQPKKPLSSYNIFFLLERKRLIREVSRDTPYTRGEVYSLDLNRDNHTEKPKRRHRKMHGMISFTNLAKNIAHKWKNLGDADRSLFDERAEEEKRKYAIEIEAFLLSQEPTPHVKKRLAALRRGSLKDYLLQPSAKNRLKTSKRPVSSVSCNHSTARQATINRPGNSHQQALRANEVSLGDDDITLGSPQSSHGQDYCQGQVEPSSALQQWYHVQLRRYQHQLRLQHGSIYEYAASASPGVSHYENNHQCGVPVPGYGAIHQVQHYFVPLASRVSVMPPCAAADSSNSTRPPRGDKFQHYRDKEK